MNATEKAAVEQTRRDLEEHRKREREAGRGAGSEFACSEWVEEARAALRHATNAMWAAPVNRMDSAYPKLCNVVTILKEALENEPEASSTAAGELPREK